MTTHPAVVTAATGAPLQFLQVPTIPPAEGEVRVRMEWTASAPLDMHQAEGGLLVKHPQVLGDGIAGSVVEIGPGCKNLNVGHSVFGFGWREQKEKAYQEFATIPEYLLGKLPSGFTLAEAVTLPNNLVTVFHAVTTDLELALPWPVPASYQPPHADDPILIWGGASSVGQYALQVLKHWGYRNLLATASPRHHAALRELGATHVFDYRDSGAVEAIVGAASTGKTKTPAVPFILDCIGSKDGSLAPITKIAQEGAKVAVLLPVIVVDATDDTTPVYALEAEKEASWAKGVTVRGVRTHFYLQNEFFKEHLQPEIIPALLAAGVVKPNKQKVVEGATLLERAQKAIDMLRRKEVSGERLVWRVAD